MGKVEFQFPIKGKDTNNPIEKQPLQTSPDLENVRPYDQLEIRMRGGQRPGCRKWGAGRIGGGDYRIDKLVAASRGSLLGDLNTEELCTEAGYYWWGGACHTYPELPGLTTANVWKTIEDNNALSVVWSYDTGGSFVYGITVDSSDNVYASGLNGTDDYDFWKLNSSGVLQWGYDVGEDVSGDSVTRGSVVDSSGNVYIVGNLTTDGDSEVGSVRKLNSSGAKQWVYDTGGFLLEIAIDTQGDIIIVGADGTDEDSDSGNIRKLNSSGVKQWFVNLVGYAATGVNVDSSDNIYVGTAGVTTGYMQKYNSSGVLQWQYDLGNQGLHPDVDSSGNVYVASARGTDEDSNVGSIRKLNSSGTLQWCYDTGGHVYAVSLDSSGNIYAAGIRTGSKSIWKLDNNGNLLWSDDTGDNAYHIAFDGTFLYIVGNRVTV